MTIQMNIAEAKAKLSELIARAEAGEQVVIARDGKPVVALAPVEVAATEPRRLGLWDDVGAEIPDDLFLGPDDEIQQAMALWEAGSIFPSA
jgi:prevent-host-death family protein